MTTKEKELEFILQSRFGSMVRQARQKQKLSQEKLSEIVGISTVYLRSLEKGEYRVNWLIMMRICAFLNIDITELCDIISESYKNNGFE